MGYLNLLYLYSQIFTELKTQLKFTAFDLIAGDVNADLFLCL